MAAFYHGSKQKEVKDFTVLNLKTYPIENQQK